ncbi:MAG: Gfo/Idh/MocA family oxidoreductase [Chitinophagaceae bacterium]|nr:MAG: Gfo/Idh/MocA family oxidoreductase [Chitinophagaceae bacterium]
MQNDHSSSRRKFLYNISLAGLSIPLLSAAAYYNAPSASKKIMSNKEQGKLGIALVGLGSYATSILAPALQQAKHCYLAAIVTGTPSKAAEWKARYNIPEKNIYNYENFDSIQHNAEIDIVYIVLPNFLHATYSIRAAQAGKHVICEKPMAITVADCDRMIAASKQAGKQLSIGYRLHFDPYHGEMIRLAKEKSNGPLTGIAAGFSFVAQKGIWRLDKEKAGGGALMDLGIYCLQAVMYLTGQEPISVMAQALPITDKERFVNIEETLNWQMEMPGGLVADCTTSYNERQNILRIEKGEQWFQLKPAFNYTGLKAQAFDNRVIEFPATSQQQLQMDAFALAVKNNQPSIVSGEMGRRDVKILQAIYEAMNTGKRVLIPSDK